MIWNDFKWRTKPERRGRKWKNCHLPWALQQWEDGNVELRCSEELKVWQRSQWLAQRKYKIRVCGPLRATLILFYFRTSQVVRGPSDTELKSQREAIWFRNVCHAMVLNLLPACQWLWFKSINMLVQSVALFQTETSFFQMSISATKTPVIRLTSWLVLHQSNKCCQELSTILNLN